jgi:hypothetical protein
VLFIAGQVCGCYVVVVTSGLFGDVELFVGHVLVVVDWDIDRYGMVYWVK